MYIETDVPESYISNVTKGKDVEVEFPILGKTIDAKIRQAGILLILQTELLKLKLLYQIKKEH